MADKTKPDIHQRAAKDIFDLLKKIQAKSGELHFKQANMIRNLTDVSLTIVIEEMHDSDKEIFF